MERPGTDEALPDEEARYRPRFRVVQRRPLVTARRRLLGSPLQRALVLAAVPALFLMIYVLFWTLAMRGGFYRSQLQGQIRTLHIERAELEAEKRRLQSPGSILARARALGMEPAASREFARIAKPQQLARRNVGR